MRQVWLSTILRILTPSDPTAAWPGRLLRSSGPRPAVERLASRDAGG